jgi:hypothetical protein
MLSKEQRKEAIGKFKERKTFLGVFAVQCTNSGRVWVGSSRNLNATRNGIWSSLRMGGHRDKELQEEWNAQGESAFEYQVLDTLKEDVSPLAVADLLKNGKRHWMKQLDAPGLL